MPIRFRCPYCSQLMAIAKRKSGAVVKCPKCTGDVVVPNTLEDSPDDEPSPEAPAPVPAPAPAKPKLEQKAGQVFEESDFSQILKEDQPPVVTAPKPDKKKKAVGPEPGPSGPLRVDVELVDLDAPQGLVVTPMVMTIAGVLGVLLLGLMFFLGWFLAPTM